MKRLVIIGLDCATPQLIFGELRDRMPNLSALMERGTWGPLTSTIPPITVPAWAAMVTSHDPGQLGLYGFHNRADRGYGSPVLADSRAVRARTLWQHLSRARLRSLVMGVPLTWPPAPLAGALVTGCLTPPGSRDCTWPPSFREELRAAAGEDYPFDVADFRRRGKGELLAGIRRMTRVRFRAFRRLFAAGDYAFGMVVEIGLDRVHHAFWADHDPDHRLHRPGSPFASAIPDYHALLDREIGLTLQGLPPECSVMVVSDHGAQAMAGAVRLNEWLRRQGHLVLKGEPSSPVPLAPDMVDWERTRAWGTGGYCGRVFINRAGREPRGIVPAGEYEGFREQLARELAALPDDRGRPLATAVHRPEATYREVRGVAPDLVVHFDALRWRSSGVVGGGGIHLAENDTGPDGANHAQEGIFVWDGRAGGRGGPFSIYDVAPTVLSWFGLPPGPGMIGRRLDPGKERA